MKEKIIGICIILVFIAVCVGSQVKERIDYNNAIEKLKQGDYHTAYEVLNAQGKLNVAVTFIKDKIITYINDGNCDEAYSLYCEFKLLDNDQITRLAIGLIEDGRYEDARLLINDISDEDSANSCKVRLAESLYWSGRYAEAYRLLSGCYDEDYRLQEWFSNHKEIIASELQAGMTVFFGKYEQDNNIDNGKEDIAWIILGRIGDSLLLLSKYALDCQPYTTVRLEDDAKHYGRYYGSEEAWHQCTLKTWLNEEFLQRAFDSGEREMIQNKYNSVLIEDDSMTEPEIREVSVGKVFVLDAEEASRYSSYIKNCRATEYAKEKGAYSRNNNDLCWWTRTRESGYGSQSIVIVNSKGEMDWQWAIGEKELVGAHWAREVFASGGNIYYTTGKVPQFEYEEHVFKDDQVVSVRPAIQVPITAFQ